LHRHRGISSHHKHIHKRFGGFVTVKTKSDGDNGSIEDWEFEDVLYGGFGAFTKLTEIKSFLMHELKKDVDLIPSNNLSKTAKESMLSKIIDV